MEVLYLEQTESTPYICFDPETKVLEIRGEAYPPNPVKFFTPILSWIDNFFLNNQDSLFIRFNMAYMNTSSTRAFVNILWTLDKYYLDGKNITVEWFYDPLNPVSLDYGNLFKAELNLPFRILKSEEIKQ